MLDIRASERDKTDQRLFFINRFLVISKDGASPSDAAKLRVSSRAFRDIICTLNLPTSFIHALSQHHLPSGRGFRPCQLSNKEDDMYEVWYLLHVRTRFKRTSKAKGHAGSTAGSSQMNPFHYLHLSNVEVDIRGSQIAVFCRYGRTGRSMTAVAINFMDERWSKSVLEPCKRVRESWAARERHEISNNPFYISSIYFSSVLRWWTNSLSSVNDQLIAYEQRLQEEIDSDASKYGVLNRALHSIAAHLHRYNSELQNMQDILVDIVKHHGHFDELKAESQGNSAVATNERVYRGLDQKAPQLKQVRAFLQELETKLQNILALLFNCIQITNDRIMASNGEKMHAILMATQEDARTSREIAEQSKILAEEMKQDSVAMKTIAVTTMFFLPGTSFAAFLAMPFFTTNRYLDDPSKLWIWITCTVPSTAIAFAFYFYSRQRETKRKQKLAIPPA